MVLSMLVSILFGLPPALQAARVDVNEPLRHGAGRLAGGDRSRARKLHWRIHDQDRPTQTISGGRGDFVIRADPQCTTRVSGVWERLAPEK